MKWITALALMVLAADGYAQIPATPQYDAEGIPVSMSAEERMRMALKPEPVIPQVGPMICANLSAKPMVTPSGDLQYPVAPCKGVDFWTAPEGYGRMPAAVRKPVTQPAKVVAQPQAAQMEQDIDLNTLQMMRLGELDAMQGRPLNMQHGNNLGYLKGYTKGQKGRVQAPGGGFGGYNR